MEYLTLFAQYGIAGLALWAMHQLCSRQLDKQREAFIAALKEEREDCSKRHAEVMEGISEIKGMIEKRDAP